MTGGSQLELHGIRALGSTRDVPETLFHALRAVLSDRIPYVYPTIGFYQIIYHPVKVKKHTKVLKRMKQPRLSIVVLEIGSSAAKC